VIRFSAQAYSFPKDPALPGDWEDSAAYSVRSGRFAVADGATQAYRSGEWAEVLTEAYITDFPAPDGLPGPQRQKVIREWFGDQVRMWHERTPATTSWWAKDAENEQPPSATFAGLQFTPDEDAAAWEATAIGDCCLFQIRHAQRELSFPLTSAAQFNTRPHLLTTAAGRLDGSLNALQTCTGRALPGDIFVLATDAASEWLLSLDEYDPRSWGRLGFFGIREFTHMMFELRAADAMATDDVAVVIIAVRRDHR
jgi:hypothetical protein